MKFLLKKFKLLRDEINSEVPFCIYYYNRQNSIGLIQDRPMDLNPIYPRDISRKR